ncbi:MAG TPA: hypothetical protein VJ992_04800 [Gemmatimonadales bacterium]|jgi:hypothetical protein|nr:hypothetical protein [Gemmatimonadales bacterium]
MTRILPLAVALLAVAACGRDRPMAESTDMNDSMPVARAMHDAKARDSMLDTMPGGEMVRGDSAAAERLLKKKM